MTTLINIIIIITVLKYVLKRLKKRIDLHVYDYLFFHIVYLVLFIVLFVVLLRFSNLMKKNNVIDLKFLYDNFNCDFFNCVVIISILYILIILRNIIFFYTKITFIKIHLYFVFISLEKNLSYHMIFYDFVNLPNKKLYFFLRYFDKINTAKKVNNFVSFLLKYLFSIIIVNICILELIFNDLKLQTVIILLPYYGLYQLIYISCCYVMDNLDFLLDVELIKEIYLYEYANCRLRRSNYIKELSENLKKYIAKLLI